MTGDEVTQVVEKLAETLGVAVDKVEPIAIETVRQVAARGLVRGIASAAIALAICVVAWAAGAYLRGVARKEEWSDEDKFTTAGLCFALPLILTLMAVLIGGAECLAGLEQWLAPIPYLLGK